MRIPAAAPSGHVAEQHVLIHMHDIRCSATTVQHDRAGQNVCRLRLALVKNIRKSSRRPAFVKQAALAELGVPLQYVLRRHEIVEEAGARHRWQAASPCLPRREQEPPCCSDRGRAQIPGSPILMTWRLRLGTELHAPPYKYLYFAFICRWLAS